MSVRSVSLALALGLGLAAPSMVAAPTLAADAPAPVQLAIAVPIAAPSGTTGLISASALAQYTSPVGLLTRELDAVIDRPITLGIDPMIIVSIRVLGSSAPDSATAWLERLRGASNETFALAYADGDLTLGLQAGSATVLTPDPLDFAIDPKLFGAADAATEPPPTATPTTPVRPPLPSSADLLSWPYTLSGLAWPRDDTVTATDLRAIAASGFDTTILSSTNIARAASPSPASTIEGGRVLVSDSVVSTSLRAAAQSPSAEDWQADFAGLTGAIAAAGAAAGGNPSAVFATLDRTIPVSGTRLADTLASLAADPAVTLVPLSRVNGSAPTDATLIDTPQAPDRVATAARLLGAEAAEHQFARVAAEPELISSPRRLALLSLLSNSWLSNPEDWSAASSDYVTASNTLRSSVQLVRSSKFLLVADNDQFLPITVGNTLNQPVTVYVSARAGSGLLVVADPLKEIVIPANAQARVDIPVRSLSNGVVTVHVTLLDAGGVMIGSPVSTEVNVQAGWETPIVVAVAVFVFLIFGFGIVRTILRRRKTARD